MVAAVPKNVSTAVIAACVALVVIITVVVRFGGDEEEVPARSTGRRLAERGGAGSEAAENVRDARGWDGGVASKIRPAERRQAAEEAGTDEVESPERRRARLIAQAEARRDPAVSSGAGAAGVEQSASVREAIAGAAEQLAHRRETEQGGGTGGSDGEVVAGDDDDDEPLFDSGTKTLPTNGYAQFGDIDEISSDAGTLSFKIRPNWHEGSQSDATMVDLGDGTMRIRKNVNYLRFEYVNEDGYEGGIGFPITTWQDGEEHDVVATWSGNHMWLYLDGKLVTQGTREGTVSLPGQPRLGIGTADAHSQLVAPGQVFEVQALNRPLTAAEVAERLGVKR